MTSDQNPNGRSPSTTWAWKRVKIPTPAGPQADATPKASPLSGLPPHPPRVRLSLTVTYRGGAECWYEITTRGRTVRRPGYTALHDLMREIYATSS